MKTHPILSCLLFCMLAFHSAIFAQGSHVRGQDADISVLKTDSGDLLDRGGNFFNGTFIKGDVAVSEYSGDLTIAHLMQIEFPNDLRTKLTLTFGANAQHTFNEDFVGRFNTDPGAGEFFRPDQHGVRENAVNVACWILGMNGIALQTTNFEKNFFVGSTADPQMETEHLFTGTQVPLLAKGYSYTNTIQYPWWDRFERCNLLGQCDTSAVHPGGITLLRDEIHIMNSQGGTITLVNPVTRDDFQSNVVPAALDYAITGTYFDADEKSSGYAIVQWKTSGAIYRERKIYYKPGDGLTYYFEEEFAQYQGYATPSQWGARLTNAPKIAYLRYIESANGDRIVFTYDSLSIFGVASVPNGRKYLKQIQYYSNSSTPVSSATISLSYIRNVGQFSIAIANNFSGERDTLDLAPSTYFGAGVSFNTLERNPDNTRSAIMQVAAIRNAANPSKRVSFSYASNDFLRRYTYGSLYSTEHLLGPPPGPPNLVSNFYHVTFPCKIMSAREIWHGERDVFTSYVDTELDGSTPIYSSYNVKYSSSDSLSSVAPEEYICGWGYFTNCYLNCPNTYYGFYRDNRWENSDTLDRYYGGYNLHNMNVAMRDNYTTTMIRSVTSSVYDDSQAGFKPICQKNYKYTWGGKLYLGTGRYWNSLPLSHLSGQIYNDLSPRVTDISTSIRNANLTTDTTSATNVYTRKVSFETIRIVSKFRPWQRWEYRNVVMSIRPTSDSLFDETHCLQSMSFSYRDNVVERYRWVLGYAWLLFYDPNTSNALDVTSKSVTFQGFPKATILSGQNTSIQEFFPNAPPFSDPNAYFFFQDTCRIRHLVADSSIVAESYRMPDSAQRAITVRGYTDAFAANTDASLRDPAYVNWGDKESLVWEGFSKGGGAFLQTFKEVTTFFTGGDSRRGRICQRTRYATAQDTVPLIVSLDYFTSGVNNGYMMSETTENATMSFQYNNQPGLSAQGLVMNGDGGVHSYSLAHSTLQSRPFKTTTSYHLRPDSVVSLTRYTAFNTKGLPLWCVDENGYYGSVWYDGIGRIVKTYKPGDFYPDLNSPYASDYASASRHGSTEVTYTDSLWMPAIRTTAYRTCYGSNPVVSKKYFLPSDLSFDSALVVGTDVLQSKEIENYLGLPSARVDGDGVKSYLYYDGMQSLSLTKFDTNTVSASSISRSTVFDNSSDYFKRIDEVDENGVITRKYCDLFKKTVRTEKMLGGNVVATRFYYDGAGRLASIVSPTNSVTSYSYDRKGNVATVASGEGGITDYIYDKFGNLRFVKDPNHKGAAPNAIDRTGTITSPYSTSDTLTLNMPGRLTISAVETNSTPNTSCTIAIKPYGQDVTLVSVRATSSILATASIILPKGKYSYVVTSRGAGGRYSFTCTCTTGCEFVYRKYDSMNRVTEEGELISTSTSGHFTQANADNPSFPLSDTLLATQTFYDDTCKDNSLARGQRNTKGRISYALAYRMGAICEARYHSYNENGDVEWIVVTQLGDYPKKLTYDYDCQGNVIKKGYLDIQTGKNLFTFYEYDQGGRLYRVYTDTMSSGAYKVKEAEYAYTPGGRVSQCKLGSLPAQTVDFTYTKRGWLSKINDPGSMGSDKFAMSFGYQTSGEIASSPSFGFSPRANGDISWAIQRMPGVTFAGSDLVGWVYGYDSLGRLSAADFGYKSSGNWTQTTSYDEKSYRYDASGNIQNCLRYGANGQVMDSLTYTYCPGMNQLDHVRDSVSASSFTSDIDNQTNGNYSYDENGNVIRDAANGIAFEIYDIRNHPIAVFRTNGICQLNSYGVMGTRVRQYISTGSDVYYVSGTSDLPEVVQRGRANNVYMYNTMGHDLLGQISVTASARTRFYYLKDQLGSIRVVVDANGVVDSYNDLRPFGQNMEGRVLVGSADTRYGYVGKERDGETGLYNLGDRFYDPKISRMTSIDPLAAVDPAISPYAYARNNPLVCIDLNGDVVIFQNPYFQAYFERWVYSLPPDDPFRLFYDALVKSPTIFYVVIGDEYRVPGKGGEVTYEGDGKVKIKLQLDDYIISNDPEHPGRFFMSLFSRIIHELTHGHQLLDQKFAFAFDKTMGKYKVFWYDLTDEAEAYAMQLKYLDPGSRLGPSSMKWFWETFSDGKPTEKTYGELAKMYLGLGRKEWNVPDANHRSPSTFVGTP